MVAVTMDSRRRDELEESVEEFDGREQQLGATMDVGFGEAVEKAALGRREGGGGVELVQAGRPPLAERAPPPPRMFVARTTAPEEAP